MDVKAFPFNYNRSQPGSPSASGPSGAGRGEGGTGGAVLSAVSHGGSYIGVKTTTQICRTFYLPRSSREHVRPSLLSAALFSQQLKISESSSSCSPLLSSPWIHLSHHLVKRFFFVRALGGFPWLLARGRGGATSRKCLIYLMRCLQPLPPPLRILCVSFRTPGLSSG